jgi:hypothetical protein
MATPMPENENGAPAEPVRNLLWALDEILIALQAFRERLAAALDKKS